MKLAYANSYSFNIKRYYKKVFVLINQYNFIDTAFKNHVKLKFTLSEKRIKVTIKLNKAFNDLFEV